MKKILKRKHWQIIYFNIYFEYSIPYEQHELIRHKDKTDRDGIMLDWDISIVLIIIILGFLAAFIDAVVGGGGLISIPALLAVGMPRYCIGY